MDCYSYCWINISGKKKAAPAKKAEAPAAEAPAPAEAPKPAEQPKKPQPQKSGNKNAKKGAVKKALSAQKRVSS